MSTIIEFNKDLFLCNKLSYADEHNCDAKYTIDYTCAIGDDVCEKCKNFKYREWYNQQNQSYTITNFEDSQAEYLRRWGQTWNLGIGIVLLFVGIYYQRS